MRFFWASFSFSSFILNLCEQERLGTSFVFHETLFELLLSIWMASLFLRIYLSCHIVSAGVGSSQRLSRNWVLRGHGFIGYS